MELLLTLEEYCSCEGVFDSDGVAAGAHYAPIFAFLLRELYEADVVRRGLGVGGYGSESCVFLLRELYKADMVRQFWGVGGFWLRGRRGAPGLACF